MSLHQVFLFISILQFILYPVTLLNSLICSYSVLIKSLQLSFLLNFIDEQLLYNVVLVSAVQQSESAICSIHIFPYFWISFPFCSLQNIDSSLLCCTVGSHQLSILYPVSIVHMCQPQSPPSSYPTPIPLDTFVLYIYALFLLCK